MNIKISQGNAKLGSIQSISLPAGLTCRNDCECSKKCYAKRLERMRPSVREAYKHNYELLKSSPNTYWREVEASIMMSRFFRFHVSGDIPDVYYLNHMVDIAERIPYELEKAITIALSGRKGPVLLDIPLNIQREEIEPERVDLKRRK